MEIKPCPFCGGDDIYTKYNGGKYGRFYYVECSTCGARTRGVLRPWREVPDNRDQDEHEWDCEAAIRAESLWDRRTYAEQTT